MRTQVEAYPNQKGPVLEALVYMSPLSYDVLMYAIVQRLASARRDKVKDDGVNAADWLQACAPTLCLLPLTVVCKDTMQSRCKVPCSFHASVFANNE